VSNTKVKNRNESTGDNSMAFGDEDKNEIVSNYL
jgi:hypothetical protein